MISLAKVAVKYVATLLVVGLVTASAWANHDQLNLVLTEEDIDMVRATASNNPFIAESLQRTAATVEQAIAEGVVIPVPKDAGGGYTHEQHKRNYQAMRGAGLLYQITGKDEYADYVKSMLMAYARMYVDLPLHPEKKEQSPGRLFWQSLNEAVWLVYVSQAYDFVESAFSEKERRFVKDNLLFPMADFLSEGQPETFDKIHNHGTWAAAAVGMTGYVTGREDYVNKALYGLSGDGQAGFMRQLDELFSPDGYYTEGPYYQRYALMPFVWFAETVDNNDPKKDIFSYRDGIIVKAIYTAIDLSYNGLFFPINDALKDKGLDTDELIHAIPVAYGVNGDDSLADIVRRQSWTSLSQGGVALANVIAKGSVEPFPFVSRQYRDGSSGESGALAILREGGSDKGTTVVAKNTSQGMGHGHFDKLSLILYDDGNEILTDYGAARFLNVVSKNGGHYLKENTTWAKQTVAHNTVVVDEKSHFDGHLVQAQVEHPRVLHFSKSDLIDITSAEIDSAYEGVTMTRTVALVKPKSAPSFVVDIFSVESEEKHQYDLPIHFRGQITDHSLGTLSVKDVWKRMGDRNGYQHMMLRAEGVYEGFAQVTWLLDKTFYTYSFSDYVTDSSGDASEARASLAFFELGATDPNFNLRREQGVLRRNEGEKSMTFVSVIEPHGTYNGAREYVKGSKSRVVGLEYSSSGALGRLNIETKNGAHYTLELNTKGVDSDSWSGGVVTDDATVTEDDSPNPFYRFLAQEFEAG